MKTGRKHRLFSFWLLPLCLASCFSCARTPALTAPSANTNWTANAAQLRIADIQVTKPGFAIRLPSTYVEVPLSLNATATPSADAVHGYQWRGGTRHPNGAYPLLIVGSIALKSAPEQPVDLHELIKERVATDTKTFQNVVTSPTEDGSLNGVTCARAYWKATVVTPRLPGSPATPVHGFLYITWNPDANTLITASGVDTDPYYVLTGKELEAAALTLKPN